MARSKPSGVSSRCSLHSAPLCPVSAPPPLSVSTSARRTAPGIATALAVIATPPHLAPRHTHPLEASTATGAAPPAPAGPSRAASRAASAPHPTDAQPARAAAPSANDSDKTRSPKQ